MSQAIVELRGVDHVYDDGTTALRAVDFSLCPGERTVLVGANGSGKSTLFLVLAGVLAPSAGKMCFEGRPFSGRRAELRSLRSRVGLVFQDPDSQLFAGSVAEDLSFGPMNMGLSGTEIDARVREALSSCGITDLADRPPHFLSYGQKKLAAIAGVVAMGCDALILDEPTSGLDGFYSKVIESLLARLNEAGTAILVSTHDQDFAWRFGRELVLMRHGSIIARGEPELLYRDRIDELEASHISPPLVFAAHESIVKLLPGTKLQALPPAPRRVEDLPAWSAAVSAAPDTLRDAQRDAARDAAHDAARDAAHDAANTAAEARGKKGLLVVSFGTSYAEALERSIAAVERDLAAAFPDYELGRAFSSGFIRKLWAGRGVKFDSPREAWLRMRDDGCDELIVQPLHLIPGDEFHDLLRELESHRAAFARIAVGMPLLCDSMSYRKVADALQPSLPVLGEGEAVLFMGHGSAHPANAAYHAMQALFSERRPAAYVATVEGSPSFDETLARLLREGVRAVTLMPLMLVAGDHALNDMAGEKDDSWKSRLIAAGLEVRTVLRGLGEIPGIRALYVEHAARAMERAAKGAAI